MDFYKEEYIGQLVDLKVGFTCNNKCSHCVVSDKISENDLTLAEIKELIDEYILKYKKINLTLTGGEITYRQDYSQIMQYLKDKKEKGSIQFVDMQTNGRMLAVNEILEETISIVDFYLIALHSDNPLIHDDITGSSGSFNETTQALSKLIKKIDIKSIAIQTVISKKNYKKLKNIYPFIYETYGISEFNITFPHPLGVAFDINITPTYSEIKDDVNAALYKCLKLGFNPYLEALPVCVFDNELQDYVFNFYNKYTKDVVGYGGKKDGHIDYSEVSKNGYSKYDTCSKCSFDKNCSGVWKEYRELYPLDDMYSLLDSNKRY